MKKWQKKDPKNSTISERPNGPRPKKMPEIIDLQGLFLKKMNFKKNRKTCDFQGIFIQKMENSMLHFSTSTPVSRRPQKSRTTCPHGALYSYDSRVLDLRFFYSLKPCPYSAYCVIENCANLKIRRFSGDCDIFSSKSKPYFVPDNHTNLKIPSYLRFWRIC